MNSFPTTAARRFCFGTRLRGFTFVCLAALAGVFATGDTVQAATCGKHFLVLKPGTRGAVVTALVEQRDQESAKDHGTSSRRKCDAPECRAREQAPAAPSTPWTRITSSSSAVDVFWVAEAERALSARSVQFWNEAGLLYDLEPAPPPTPPPRS